MTDEPKIRLDPSRSESRAKPKTSASPGPSLLDLRRGRDPIDEEGAEGGDAGEGYKGPLVDATLVDETKVPHDTDSEGDRSNPTRGGRSAS